MSRALAGLVVALAGFVPVVGCGSSNTHVASERLVMTRAALPRATQPRDSRLASQDETVRELGVGEDAARATLFALLDALLTGDVEASRRLLGEEPFNAHALRTDRERPDAFVLGRRDVVIQRLLAARRAARLPDGVAVRDVIDTDRIEIASARALFGDDLPGGLEPADLIVRFDVDETAGRALQAISAEGRGLIVVRVTTTGAFVVGL